MATPTTVAREHVEEIRRLKFSIGGDSNPLMEDLHQAVRNLSAELYTKDVHFLMELVQNAEDNEYQPKVDPSLEFVITSKDITGTGATATLLVFNNEVGFSKKNIESVCSIGRSTKKGKRQEGYIGEKGIGFKSVFLVCTHPYIFSNGYQIRFSEQPDPDCGIGYIVPEWVDAKPMVSDLQNVYGSSKTLPTTTIVLPLKSKKVKAVKKQLSKMHPELLLFLSKIKKLSVRKNNGDSRAADTFSEISMSSETDPLSFKDKRANSCILHLSAQKGTAENKCSYYIWRQAFPVKPEAKVDGRKEMEEWVISLAFPFGERLKKGTSSAGIYAFLPTAMITNFNFIIQADFILSSSRETVLFDSKWNMGILGCVPSAFVNAFVAFMKSKGSTHLSYVTSMFEFLPLQVSSVSELNNVRETIRTMLKKQCVVHYESFSDDERVFCVPTNARRLLPAFRKLLDRAKEEGISLKNIYSSGKLVLHSSLDLTQYNTVLHFLGVVPSDSECNWYAKCIEGCELAQKASAEVYMELLCFIADNWNLLSAKNEVRSIPLIGYITPERRQMFSSILYTNQIGKVRYASNSRQHAWLNKSNTEFGCSDGLCFLYNSIQVALVSHVRSSFLRIWLSNAANVVSTTVYDSIRLVQDFIRRKGDQNLVKSLAHFLYHTHVKNLISESQVYSVCESMPVIDGRGQICVERTETLIPASGSNWVKLMGYNPFIEKKYIDLGESYAESGTFAGEHTQKEDLLNFLTKYMKAKDLPELHPPDLVLPVASLQLKADQALLLLEWIRTLHVKKVEMPATFIKSIRVGKWIKTCSGFNSPTRCFLFHDEGECVFLQMGNVLKGFSVIDEQFYGTKIRLYADELKLIGVRFGSVDVCRLIINHVTSLPSSRITSKHGILLLQFIRYLKKREKFDDDFLRTLKRGEWMKSSKGYVTPFGSVFLPSITGALLQITNLPIIDETFYGNKFGCYTAELKLLGVVMEMEEVYKLTADNFTFPEALSTVTRESVLVILRCLRNLGPSAAGLIEKISCEPWLKTSLGFKSPSSSFLPNSEYRLLLNVVEVPLIDESFYGNEIRLFISELKAIGVVVDFESSIKTVAVQFKSLSSSGGLTSVNVLSLLNCTKNTKETMPSLSSTFRSFLFGENWLKTRHGFKSPPESILFDVKWGTISQYVDLPLIDDAFYGIGVYGYRKELKMMGVVVDFKDGCEFVARGLNLPKEPGLIERESTLSLLECIGYLLEKSSDRSLPEDFLKNTRESKWLKTHMGYRSAEESLLFDPGWKSILSPKDGPFIDERFYGDDISFYRDPLKAIGVKVNAEDVCELISEGLLLNSWNRRILRIYSFLNKFGWKPKSHDKSITQVWIPVRPRRGGEWVSSKACVIHDRDGLFGLWFYVLDKDYKSDLLPIFSSAFGVSMVPSTNDYVNLWNDWELNGQHEVSLAKCCSFWTHVLENWNPKTEEILKEKITKLPSCTASGDRIQLVEKDKLFIPDDLQLKKMFMEASEDSSLFVWYPQSSLQTIDSSKLYKVYSNLGVQKISKSVHFSPSSFSNHDSLERVDPRDGLIAKGLIKIILGYLAGPQIIMPVKERHKAAQALIDLVVFKTGELTVDISLVYGEKRLDLQTSRMVVWDKDSHRMLVHSQGWDDRSVGFATGFAQAVAEGLLHESPGMIEDLCRIIQMGFVYRFKEDAVDFLLMKENLHLFVEDGLFLSAAFPSEETVSSSSKRKAVELELLPSQKDSTSSKKRR